MHHVTDPLDPQLDGFRAIRARESREVLWAEGPTVVERLLRSSHRTRSILATPSQHEQLAPLLCNRNVDLFVAERNLIAEVLGFDLHRGVIAIADRPSLVDLDDTLSTATLIVLLEGVNDAENLGAIARSARGLGADALVLDPTCADPWYRRSVRVSMGELLHLPVVRSTDWFETLDRITRAGFEIWALTPSVDAIPVHRMTVPGRPGRLAVMLGAEGPGLPIATLQRTTNVRIPMHHGVDSLNVGHALAATLAIVQGSNDDDSAE